MLDHDLLWHAMKCFEIRKSYEAQLDLKVMFWLKWFMNIYVECDMWWKNGSCPAWFITPWWKYGDLMHICMYTCIEILPFYDEYKCIHCETGMTIMLSMVQRPSLSLRVSSYNPKGAISTSRPRGCASSLGQPMLVCVGHV